MEESFIVHATEAFARQALECDICGTVGDALDEHLAGLEDGDGSAGVVGEPDAAGAQFPTPDPILAHTHSLMNAPRLYSAAVLRQTSVVVRRHSPIWRRCGWRLWLAGGLAAAALSCVGAEPPAATAPPPFTFSDYLTSAERTYSAPRLKPLDNLDLNYLKSTPLPGPEAIARGQRDPGEDVFSALYERPLARDVALQVDGSLRFPQERPATETGAAQGGLAVNNFTTRAVYAGTDAWSLKPFYSHTMWNYQDRAQATAMDRAASSLGFDADWQLTRRTRLTSVLQSQQVDYTTAASSYRAEIASFGIEQQLTGRLRAAASVGTELRQEFAGKRMTNPTNDLNLSYALPYDATLTVGRRQAIQENYAPDFYEELNEAYYSRLSQRVLPNLQLDTSAALEFANRNGALAAGQPLRNEFWQFQLAPSYQLREDLSAQLGYSLKVYTLPAVPNQPLDNAVFLSLKLTY